MVVTNRGVQFILFLALVTLARIGYAEDNLLKRKVTLKVIEQPLEKVLNELSNLANFTFSYDASIMSDEKVSFTLEDGSVKSALNKILPKGITYKVSGNHLILLKKATDDTSGKKEKYNISGHVYHAVNQTPLHGIIVYEVSSLVSAVTNQKGAFSLSIPTQFAQLGLSFNQKGVEDTIIFLAPHDQVISVSLVPAKEVSPAKPIRDIPFKQVAPVESLPLVQHLVPDQSRVRTENMSLIRQRVAQISFMPTWGSNLKMSGLIKNKLSLNVLAGYAYGLNILEVSGLFSVIRKDVDGVQLAGLGNLVGGDTRGVQLAGLFNHNRGSMVGFQVSGINNMLIDSLRGAQFAGINNILKGEMRGVQIAGVNNLTTGSVDGMQLAGLTNVAFDDVKNAQIAGLVNVGENVTGTQISGLVNFAQGDVTGFQLAGLVNKTRNVDAFQLAGIGNISNGRVSGTQISGIFNYAQNLEGTQMALFNIADTASGTPMGLLSFVKKGFHTIELSSNEVTPLQLAFKTGVKRFYNVFSGEWGNWSGKSRWAFGYGFGSERSLAEKLFLSMEYSAHWVNETNTFQNDLSLLNRLTMNFGYRKPKGIAFSAGPVVNVWLSEWRDAETGEYLTNLAPYTLADEVIGTTRLQMWVGGKVAIQL